MAAEEVFVGREEEIQRFHKFLEKGDCPAFVVIGEPGIGKSSFLREISKRLKEDSQKKIVVGFCEVPRSPDIVSPFTGALEELMKKLVLTPREIMEDALKKAASSCLDVLKEEGYGLAKLMIRGFAVRVFGKETVEAFEKEFKKVRKKWKEKNTIFSLADDMISKSKKEFIYDYLYFFEKLVEGFEGFDFVLLFDQFERAQIPSCDMLLDFISRKPERVHVVVSFKVEETGIEKFDQIKSDLTQLKADIRELPPLSAEELDDWITRVRKKFSYSDLKRIRGLSGGFPFLISEWLRSSEKLDLEELKGDRERYCEFIRWRLSGLPDECKLLLRKLSVLLQELPIEDYEVLGEAKVGKCTILLEKLEDKWILSKRKDTFWFRHELIQACIERKLSSTERKRYHSAAASLFQKKFDYSAEADGRVHYAVGLGCAYHHHHAGNYAKSLEHNSNFASFCYDIGALDTSESCYLAATKDAEALKNEHSAMAAKGNLARVYEVWGRIDDAFKTHQELLEYFRSKKDPKNEATSLHHLAMIHQDRGEYEEAAKLYNESLKILRRLGDQRGISASLHQLAMIHQDRGEYEEAAKLYNESLKIRRRLGDQRGIAISYGALGSLYESLGNKEKAIKYYEDALAICERIGDKPHAKFAKQALSRVRKNSS